MAQPAAVKETVFRWEGMDRQGHRLKGEMPAKNMLLLKAELRRQGIVPVKTRKKSALFSSARKKRIRPKDIAVFTRQAATMLRAGVPLVQSLEMIGRGHENPSMQELIVGIKNDVEAGSALAEALQKRPIYFDELYTSLVRAGEQAGALEELLEKIATYKERTESIKGKIKKAMFYPSAVIVAAVIVTSILLIFVIPQFRALFQSFGADLPAFTLFVIWLSEVFQSWWWAIFGSIGLAAYAFFEARRRSERFSRFLGRISLKVPILGDIFIKAAIARFARTLSVLFAAGVPLVEGMQSVAGATGNAVYSEAVMRMREQVSTGQQLQMAMRVTGLFPNMVIQMVQIGEESGSLESMLAKVADFYEEEVNNAVDALSSLIEPMVIMVLGVVIGGLVVAMYMPIFKLAAVI
jgi:type IV pilus assembly protein PilC